MFLFIVPNITFEAPEKKKKERKKKKNKEEETRRKRRKEEKEFLLLHYSLCMPCLPLLGDYVCV